jgi:hypothetical protein
LVKPSLLIVLQSNIIDNMSIIGSPFDLSADIFTHKYAAQDDGQGQQGGQATNDFQTTGSYDTACDVLKAWRNCKISTSDAKVKVRELVSDAKAWESKDWDDFFEYDCPDIPNERTREAEASAWGEWSDCAPNWMGQGTQNRQRTIVKKKRRFCIDDPFHGITLNEFRDCELPDDSGSGDSGSGDSGSGDSGSGDSGSGDSGSGDSGSGDSGSGDGTNITIMGDTDDSESSFGDTLKDNWVLVGVALVGLALLR